MIGGVTISDVARAAGCNKSTASRALRNLPGVDPRKAELIKAVARDLGYQPDPVQCMAAAHRWKSPGRLASHTVAYLGSDLHDSVSEREGWRHRQRHLAEHAKERVERVGSHFELFNLSEYRKASALARILKARGIRGVIVPPLSPAAQIFLEEFEWQSFSSVALKTGWVLPPCHSVDIDEWAGIHRAWSELRKRGYERIGFAPGRHNPMAVDDYIRHGACFSIRSGHASACTVPIYLEGLNDRKAFLSWFRQEKPDAVVTFSNRMIDWMREDGFGVPEDVGAVSLHVNDRFDYSGLIPDHEGISTTAVDFLITEIRNNHWGIPARLQRTLVAPIWNDGTTLKAVPFSEEDDPAFAESETAVSSNGHYGR